MILKGFDDSRVQRVKGPRIRVKLLQARPPAKPARHSPEAQPMADGQGETAWGVEGEAVVIYCEPSATQVEDPANSGEMRQPRLSNWV